MTTSERLGQVLDGAAEMEREIRGLRERLANLEVGLTTWCERTEAGNAMEAPVDQRCTRELRALLGEDLCTCDVCVRRRRRATEAG